MINRINVYEIHNKAHPGSDLFQKFDENLKHFFAVNYVGCYHVLCHGIRLKAFGNKEEGTHDFFFGTHFFELTQQCIKIKLLKSDNLQVEYYYIGFGIVFYLSNLM